MRPKISKTAMDELRELCTHMVRSVVTNEDAVVVYTIPSIKGIILEIHADECDAGKVIGARGSTINAMRQVLEVLAQKHGIRVKLDYTTERTEARNRGGRVGSED